MKHECEVNPEKAEAYLTTPNTTPGAWILLSGHFGSDDPKVWEWITHCPWCGIELPDTKEED